MNLSCGIVGLPNVGKSTLFNALLARQVADIANYPFCTIEPNIGVIEVPDSRLEVLAKIAGTEKIVPSIVKFVDIAGLVKGAHQGEGLGNKFLSHIREVNLILYTLRSFEDEEIIRSESVDPGSDFGVLETELILADLSTLNRQTEIKGSKDPKHIAKNSALQKLKEALGSGKPARKVELSKEEADEIKSLNLLTMKPALAVLNISEKDLAKGDEIIKESKIKHPELISSVEDIIPVSAKIEFELKKLSGKDRKDYLAAFSVEKSGLDILIPKVFHSLGLISFLTAGEKEVRAWTIEKGTDARHAAGTIHGDFEKGFVKAAVVTFEEFVKYDGWKRLQEAGKVRYEGKEYTVKDGDVIEFMVNA